jgi:hypothetical protein
MLCSNVCRAAVAWVLVVHSGVGAQSVAPERALTNVPATTTTTQAITLSCCKELREGPKTALPNEKSEFKLNDKSPVHDFGQGAQPYLLIELPEFTATYSINIVDLPQNPGVFNANNYSQLALQIQTLDANFAPKREYGYANMKKRGLGYEKTVFINPQNNSEKYLLVRGVLNISPQEVTISKTDMMFVGTGYFIGGTDAKLTVQPTSMGVVMVDVKNPLQTK